MAALCQWITERVRSICPGDSDSVGRYKKTDKKTDMREDSDDYDLMDEENGRNEPSADRDKGVANTLQYHPYTDDPKPNEATAPYRDNPDTHEAEDRYTDHPASTQTGMFTPENSPAGSPRDDDEEDDDEEEYLVDPAFTGNSQFEDLSENLVPAAPHTIDQPMHVGTPLQVDGKDTTQSFRKIQEDVDEYLRSVRSETEIIDPEGDYENKRGRREMKSVYPLSMTLGEAAHYCDSGGNTLDDTAGMDIYPDMERTSTV